MDPGIELKSATVDTIWWTAIRGVEAYSTLKSIYSSSWNKYAHQMNHPR
jgi:hypothetical protein